MRTEPGERPVSLQLFGSDPCIISEMAAYIEDRPFDILDINMGCPVPQGGGKRRGIRPDEKSRAGGGRLSAGRSEPPKNL